MEGARALARIQVGIPGFDELVHGGLPKGRSSLLAGSTGTGKTVFGLQFLAAGAAMGEPGVLVTFAERPEDLIENAASFGWDLDGLVRDRRLVDRGRDARRRGGGQRLLRSRRALGADLQRARRDRGHAAVPGSDRRAVRGVRGRRRGAARVRRDAACAAAAGRHDADRRRAPERGRPVHELWRGGVRRRQRDPAPERARDGAPAADGRGPQAPGRRPLQGRVPVRHRRGRGHRDRAVLPDRGRHQRVGRTDLARERRVGRHVRRRHVPRLADDGHGRDGNRARR